MGNTGGAPVKVSGLTEWVRVLKGPEFRDVNNALRDHATRIAEGLVPDVERAVGMSRAPQAAAMRGTVKAKRDRVPVLSIGAKNPKFRHKQGRKPPFTRSGTGAAAHRRRRGAIAHGVIYGTKGGHLKGGGDFYGIPRDDSGGPVGRAMTRGRAFDAATDAYFKAYQDVLRDAGIKLHTGRRAA